MASDELMGCALVAGHRAATHLARRGEPGVPTVLFGAHDEVVALERALRTHAASGLRPVAALPLDFTTRLRDGEIRGLARLARESEREILVRDGKFSFAAPTDATRAPAAGGSQQRNPLVLQLGLDLLRFRSVLTSAQQAGTVEVRGWDVATKKALTATAPAKTTSAELPTVTPADLGEAFGATLTEAEVRWLMDREWARTAEDVLWRRSKLGLRVTPGEAARLDAWMRAEGGEAAPVPAAALAAGGRR